MCNDVVQTYENAPRKAETSNMSMHSGQMKENKNKASF